MIFGNNRYRKYTYQGQTKYVCHHPGCKKYCTIAIDQQGQEETQLLIQPPKVHDHKGTLPKKIIKYKSKSAAIMKGKNSIKKYLKSGLSIIDAVEEVTSSELSSAEVGAVTKKRLRETAAMFKNRQNKSNAIYISKLYRVASSLNI